MKLYKSCVIDFSGPSLWSIVTQMAEWLETNEERIDKVLDISYKIEYGYKVRLYYLEYDPR